MNQGMKEERLGTLDSAPASLALKAEASSQMETAFMEESVV